MKKIIVFLFFFVLSISNVNAAQWYRDYNDAKDPNTDLIYNVEEFWVSDDSINIKGWFFLDMINTIALSEGSQNFDLYIIALRKSDVASYKNNRASVSHYRKHVEIFSGENDLYSTLCYHIGVGYCNEVFFGYKGAGYVPSGNDVVTNAGIQSGVPYASCKPTATNPYPSCTHYNPYFEVKLLYSEIESKISLDDEITFIIEAEYDILNVGTNGGCHYDSSKNDDYFINCKGNGKGNRDHIISRILTITDDYTSRNGILKDESSLGVVKNIHSDYQLYNVIETGLIRRIVSGAFEIYEPNERNYFSYGVNGVFNIENVKKMEVPQKKLQGYHTREINYYGVKFNSDGSCDVDDWCYHSYDASGIEGYASSTWGGIEGYISIKLETVPEPPDLPNCLVDLNGACEYNGSISCFDLISKSFSNDFLNQRLNSSCPSAGSATLTVKKVYDIVESFKFNYNEDLFDISKKYWPGIKLDKEFKYSFERNISYSNSLIYPDYYLYVSFYKNFSTIPGVLDCREVSGYVDNDFLTTRGVNINFNTLNLESEVKNKSEKEPKLSYNYLNSNDAENKYIKSSNIILTSVLNDDSYSVDGYKVDYNIKKAFINKNSGIVRYKNSGNSMTEIDSGSYYFIPFNVKNGGDDFYVKSNSDEKLYFYTNLLDVGLYADVDINSVCYVNLEPGNLENMRYRVIDLQDPFPNVRGNNYPKNWIELLTRNNNNLKFLYNRYIANNKEYYKANLTTNNISLVRENNDNNLNGKYLEVGSSDDKTLLNNSNIFSSGNVYKYKVGTKEVAR